MSCLRIAFAIPAVTNAASHNMTRSVLLVVQHQHDNRRHGRLQATVTYSAVQCSILAVSDLGRHSHYHGWTTAIKKTFTAAKQPQRRRRQQEAKTK